MRCVATILVMENDEAVAELLAEVVRRLGHTPHDPRETWQLPESFAAVVLEPGDAGTLGWARLLRSLRPDLPLVCVSRYDRLPEAIELGPAAYLLKPFPLAELEHALREIVAQ